MDWIKFFSDPSMVTLLVGAVIAVVVLVMWHRADDDFDLRQLLVDPKTGKLSLSQLGILVALITSTWGFIAQIQDSKMTEFYFIGYMTAWTAFGAYLKSSENKKDKSE